MEISVENVIEKFKLYSGEALDDSDLVRDELCKELCGECVMWVKRRVKPEVLEMEEAEEESAALESLAASEAFWQLAMLDQAMAPQEVSSPELKVHMGDKAGYAQKLRDEKGAACAGLLCEDGFYFGLT